MEEILAPELLTSPTDLLRYTLRQAAKANVDSHWFQIPKIMPNTANDNQASLFFTEADSVVRKWQAKGMGI